MFFPLNAETSGGKSGLKGTMKAYLYAKKRIVFKYTRGPIIMMHYLLGVVRILRAGRIVGAREMGTFRYVLGKETMERVKKITGLVATVLVVTSVLCVTAAPARADIIVTFVSVVPVAGGFTWTYDATLGPNEETQETDLGGPFPTLFTLYDLSGLVPGSETQPSSSWTPSEQLTGVTPPGVSPIPPDDPTVLNITWSYGGTPSVIDDGTTSTDLGLFTFKSTFGGTSSLIAFSQEATKNNPGKPDDDTQIAGRGQIVGPDGSTTIPEPSSLLILGSGLLGFAGFAKKKLLFG